jgi:U32 family peptidase
MHPRMPRKPELLAPAGDLDSLRAALASGADAVYFGLDDGFNARARASNFSLERLPETLAMIHRAGARAYLTVNTLVFEPELPVIERLLAAVAAAGVDALIVQDPAVALLARALCPELELHGSTQMTISSPEGARFAAGLGMSRVVVPRELSVAEIRRFAADTDLELEVFIHGALCVSWSGQCLTSEAWGGRSANRGQCAQSCRMPYELVVDGTTRALADDVAYLLSPKDLAGVAAVPDLVDVGVHGLKIEGRLKGPEYVASAVGGYRRWLDGVVAGTPDEATLARDLTAMSTTYSRGFSPGFLGGSDHQSLVEGRFPKHRGAYLGRVVEVRAREVIIDTDDARPWTGGLGLAREQRPARPEGRTSAPLPDPDIDEVLPRAGMGVVFDAGDPEDKHEPGGPLFRAEREGRTRWRLGFGSPGPDLARVAPGQRVWITSDPEVARRTRQLLDAGGAHGRVPLTLVVTGRAGEPLTVRASARGHEAGARTTSPLSAARASGLDATLLADKLGALGDTPFTLCSIDTSGLTPGLHVPVSELKALRRELVGALTARVERGPLRSIATASVLESLRPPLEPAPPAPPVLVPLCRTDAQLDAVIAAGLPEVELDWMELVGLGRAVERARAAGLAVGIATVRVQKPGEEGFDQRIARLEPDAVLVRHWGALMHFREHPGGRRPVLHGDFSLNVTNSITARHLLGLGLDTLTAAHDLDTVQLFALLEHAPAERITVTLHHHIATFHTEHCVYAHLLSGGRDFRSCGRPCEAHALSLRDRVGLEHPVIVDVGCRNTVFNAQAQSAASLVPELRQRGVRRFRVEFVREGREDSARVLAAYRALLAGELAPAEAVRRAGVHEQFGVTRGTMRVLS